MHDLTATMQLADTDIATAGRTRGRLSGAQIRFAAEHRATPMMRAALYREAVYMYRTDPTRTQRWLIGCDGLVLDQAAFQRHSDRTNGAADDSSLTSGRKLSDSSAVAHPIAQRA